MLVILRLFNSKPSVFKTGTMVASSPAHLRSTGESGTTYSSTLAAVREQSAPRQATAIDLYNLTRIKSASSGEASDTNALGSMKMEIQVQSVSEAYEL